ncbi:MAG TPA: hypothetical protein PK675_04300 [Clostridia bacterium]|nr:hypothetical protein [Clostridia bacterium]
MEKKENEKKLNRKGSNRSFANIFVRVLIISGLLVLLAYILKIVISWLVENFIAFANNTDAVVIVALMTGSISVIGVIISSIVAKSVEYRQNTKKYLYGKREEPYSDLAEFIYKIRISENLKEGISDEIFQDVSRISRKLTLWGSSAVLKKWLTFRKYFATGATDDLLLLLEDVLFEIRTDLGQKRGGLRQGDLLTFFDHNVSSNENEENI